MSAPSGLQVSFFRAVEAVADLLPEREHEGDRLAAAAGVLSPALSDTQKAQATERLKGYLHRRAHAEEAWARRLIREGVAATNYGHESGAHQCLSRTCSAWKSSPAAACPACGDEPVTHNGDPVELNRAHGYAT